MEDVYRRDAPAVRWHAARAAMGDFEQAGDATQAAFMEAIRDWDKFRLLPPERQRSWLIVRAKHRVIDGWRKAGPELPTDSIPDRPAPGAADDTAVSAAAVSRYFKAISTMPARVRHAAYLRWHEDWTPTMIAHHLGVDRATVYRDLQAAIVRAREELADEF